MILIVKDFIVYLCMIINTVLDIKDKSISVFIVSIGIVTGILLKILQSNLWSFESLLALIPGIVFFLISFVTKEQVGYGDALIVLMLGCFVTGIQLLSICTLAVWLAGIFSLVLIVLFHKKRNYKIPFVPFLFCGFVIVRCFQ